MKNLIKRNMIPLIAFLSIFLLWCPHSINTDAANYDYSATYSFKRNKTVNHSKSLEVGETLKLTLKYGNMTISPHKLSFKSSKTSIAKISKKGIITAKKTGSCKITIKRKGKKNKIIIKLTVKKKGTTKIPVTGVRISDSDAFDMYLGHSYTLNAVVIPSNATDKRVVWSTSDASVLSVSQDGTITGIGVGRAYATVKTVDGNYSDTCYIEIIPIDVKSVNITDEHVTLYLGNSKQLTAIVSPADATDKTISWSSSDSSIATVSNTGLVNAVGYGSCAITARSNSDSSISDICSITVPEYVSKDGQCGEKISYHLEGYRGDIVLSITGTGDMYSSYKTGWEDYSSDIKTIKMSNGITSIKTDAFKGFKKLESINIPETLKSIGDSAFYDCIKLEKIEFPNSLTSIGNYAFSGCGLKSVNLKSSLTNLGVGAFSYCDGLTSIVIPEINGLQYKYTFSNCDGITVAHVYSNNTYNALSSCDNIEVIYIMQGITKASLWANKVKKLYLPLSIESFEQYAEEFYYPGSESDFKNVNQSGSLSSAIPHFNYNW